MVRAGLFIALVVVAAAPRARYASPQTVKIPAEESRWDLQGNARVTDYAGRRCVFTDGGAAVLRNFVMRDAVVDVDVTTAAPRGFFGMLFRLADEGATGEDVYLRPHKSGLPDAIQYTPMLRTGRNWQIYNGPGFTGAVDIPRSEWFHLRLEVAGAQAKLFVKNMDAPALTMSDLKSGAQKGDFALYSLTGATCFSNLEIRPTPDAPWMRHEPPMPPHTLVRWSLSPSYDATQRNVERTLSADEEQGIPWEDVAAEPPGFVVIYRYRDAPHIAVSFANDFSKRLEPQPGTRLVYARTFIDVDRDEVKRLDIGYSDEVSVFLNGEILYRGRSAQNFRDPGFLGIVNPENDAVYLPLRRGRNELLLAVSELGGGWGFICRLEDPAR